MSKEAVKASLVTYCTTCVISGRDDKRAIFLSLLCTPQPLYDFPFFSLQQEVLQQIAVLKFHIIYLFAEVSFYLLDICPNSHFLFRSACEKK